MTCDILVQPTPNPNAYKFILSRDVIEKGKISYKRLEECGGNLLAKALFMLGGVEELHFFENVITVTKTDSYPWVVMEEAIRSTILQNIGQHDPYGSWQRQGAPKIELSAELQPIDAIIDRTIRPGLRMDGGDVVLLKLDGHILTIHYEGACGSCPSSQAGTLDAIQSILRQEYDPLLEIIAV